MQLVSKKYIFQLVALVAIFIGAFLLVRIMEANQAIQQFIAQLGYLGVLVVSFISGLNLIVPIPAVAFVPLFIGAGLNMWAVFLVMTIGMTAADSVAYLVGMTGRRLANEVAPALTRSSRGRQNHYLAKIDAIRKRFYVAPLLILFLYAAFIPFPNEILVIPLAFMGYSLKHMLFPLFFGSAILNAWSGFLVLNITGLL